MHALVDFHYVYVYVLLAVKGRIKGPMQMKMTVVVQEKNQFSSAISARIGLKFCIRLDVDNTHKS